MKDISKILIPSGPTRRIDIQRVEGPFKKYGKTKKYVILGSGPDTLEALKYKQKEIPKELDHHVGLYRFVMNNIPEENVEFIDTSTTAVQNLLHFFKKEKRNGLYLISTDEWQISKYKHIFKSLRRKGLIPEGVNLEGFQVKTDSYYNSFQKLASWAKSELELKKI
jgi:hypothetical protein